MPCIPPRFRPSEPSSPWVWHTSCRNTSVRVPIYSSTLPQQWCVRHCFHSTASRPSTSLALIITTLSHPQILQMVLNATADLLMCTSTTIVASAIGSSFKNCPHFLKKPTWLCSIRLCSCVPLSVYFSHLALAFCLLLLWESSFLDAPVLGTTPRYVTSCSSLHLISTFPSQTNVCRLPLPHLFISLSLCSLWGFNSLIVWFNALETVRIHLVGKNTTPQREMLLSCKDVRCLWKKICWCNTVRLCELFSTGKPWLLEPE